MYEGVILLQMNVKLINIGTITTGVYEKSSPSGDTYYLQSQHFDEHGKFRENVVLNHEINMESRLEKHILQEGDLLIMAKGNNNRVCFYSNDIGQSVASSTFFVIRLKSKKITPEYLQWYLNTSKMQGMLSSLSKGTHILSLSKKSLSTIEIEIPSIEMQQNIISVQSLWRRESVLSLELLKQKEKYYEYSLLNTLDKKN